jgi:hypothetical protein
MNIQFHSGFLSSKLTRLDFVPDAIRKISTRLYFFVEIMWIEDARFDVFGNDGGSCCTDDDCKGSLCTVDEGVKELKGYRDTGTQTRLSGKCD